jgi:hemin uptake protein HemP
MQNEARDHGRADRVKTGAEKAKRRVSSRTLLGDANELIIEHAGREYRLRVTQSNKLILTA